MKVGGRVFGDEQNRIVFGAERVALIHQVEDLAVAQERRVRGDGVEPGIAEDEVVGTAGGAVNGWVFGVGIAGNKLGSGEGGEVAAGGEANDDDAIGIDVVIRGAGADGLDGAAGVEERDGKEVAAAS